MASLSDVIAEPKQVDTAKLLASLRAEYEKAREAQRAAAAAGNRNEAALNQGRGDAMALAIKAVAEIVQAESSPSADRLEISPRGIALFDAMARRTR